MTPTASMTAEAAEIRRRAMDYVELTKPRLVILVLLTTWVGFHLGALEPDWALLLATLVGTSLAGAGSQALNQYAERESDGRMRRTQSRPLAAGRVDPGDGLAFGLLLAATGVAFLWLSVNGLAAGLAALTIASYLGAYTPLKTRSPLSTLVGCVPGALPPMIGWAAARGSLGPGAWALFAILFFWQVPHSLAIAWLYRKDYARAGAKLLPVVEPDGRSTGRQVALNCALLLLVGLVPAALGLVGPWYLLTALVLGTLLLVLGIQFALAPTIERTRRVLVGTYLHLPLVLSVLALDRLA